MGIIKDGFPERDGSFDSWWEDYLHNIKSYAQEEEGTNYVTEVTTVVPHRMLQGRQRR